MVRGNIASRCASFRWMRQTGRLGMRVLLAGSLAIGACLPAQALLVGTTPDVIPNTWTYPGDNPGYYNIGKTGTYLNTVYLGDGWVLSAMHTGISTVKFEHMSTVFRPIPNQGYIVPNPTGMGLSATTDLRLQRIVGDSTNVHPGLPSLTIGSQPLTLNAEVMYVSYGVTRNAAESHFAIDLQTSPPAWGEVPDRSTYNGYKSNGQGKRWGTNHIADDNVVMNEYDANLTTNLYTTRGNVISYLTTYDENSSNPYESQAVGGDSGSGVFHKRDGQWELAGIVHSNIIHPGQSIPGGFNSPNALAIYGNSTAFADLSSYRSQILAIMTAQADYSIAGDVNMDGYVSGNGTGPASSDDVTAFVQGWRYDNGTGKGTILSWSKGDLNRDGAVNAADFFKLRQAFGTAGGAEFSVDAIGAALFGLAVPEPSTAMLFLLAGGAILVTRRRRSSTKVS